MKLAARFRLVGMRQVRLEPADAEVVGAALWAQHQLGNAPCMATSWDLGSVEISAFEAFLGCVQPGVGSVCFEFGAIALGPFIGSSLDRYTSGSSGCGATALVHPLAEARPSAKVAKPPKVPQGNLLAQSEAGDTGAGQRKKQAPKQAPKQAVEAPKQAVEAPATKVTRKTAPALVELLICRAAAGVALTIARSRVPEPLVSIAFGRNGLTILPSKPQTNPQGKQTKPPPAALKSQVSGPPAAVPPVASARPVPTAARASGGADRAPFRSAKDRVAMQPALQMASLTQSGRVPGPPFAAEQPFVYHSGRAVPWHAHLR